VFTIISELTHGTDLPLTQSWLNKRPQWIGP